MTKFSWDGTLRTYDLENEIVASGVYPRHGQVTPAEWQIEGQTYKGFGRFPTISEVGLHFICTADGLNDKGSYRVKSAGGWTADEQNSNKNGVSGGRTAERLNNAQDKVNGRFTDSGPYGGSTEDRTKYWYSNYPPEPSADTVTRIYGCTFKKNYGRGDDTNPATHPGCQPENWNATLKKGSAPLTSNQKRIQVALLLEFFVPSVGYTKYAPEWTLVLDGERLNGIKVRDVITGKNESVFSTTENQVLKSNLSFGGSIAGLDNSLGAYPLGGSTSPRATTLNRRVKGTDSMPNDPGYDNSASSDIHGQLLNYPLVGNFFTVDRIENIQFEVQQPLIAKIYATHDWQKVQALPVQSFELEFPKKAEAPPPELVRYSIERRLEESYQQETIDAPRWWAFNWGGALYRWRNSTTVFPTSSDGNQVINWKYSDVKKDDNTEENRRTRGRFHGLARGSSTLAYDKELMGKLGVGAGATSLPVNSLLYGYTPSGGYSGVLSRPQDRSRENIDYYEPPKSLGSAGEYKFFGTDTVRSILPKYGDYRLVAARKTVPAKTWIKHKLYDTDSFFAHNFSAFFSTTEVGFYRGGTSDTDRKIDVRLVANTTYPDQFIPDTPQTKESSDASTRYGDFDAGPGNTKDGAYINKPDEGNLSVIRLWYPYGSGDGASRYYRNAYFQDQYMQLPAREAFFTPNRMISSSGMFGSLPTGVFGSQGKDSDSNSVGQSWRTLLFRPHVSMGGTGSASGNHPGAPAYAGGVSPADHYIMDLFWMPVVGPYAISDSWSTAGKININFQIVPFTYINRATAVYAAMKGELLTSIPKEDATITSVTQRKGAAKTKSYKQHKDEEMWPPLFFSEKDKKYWHRYIDLASTTALMKARMDMDPALPTSPTARGLFRTASQICEVHLVPETIAGAKFNPGSVTVQNASATMAKFWQDHAITGDNIRERPYANIYQKITARSNTYRVHFRAQAMKKARSLDPTMVKTVSTAGSSTDSVIAEYRGSALIERYLDMNTTLPDYAQSGDPLASPSLENYYRYRVLEAKQFAP